MKALFYVFLIGSLTVRPWVLMFLFFFPSLFPYLFSSIASSLWSFLRLLFSYILVFFFLSSFYSPHMLLPLVFHSSHFSYILVFLLPFLLLFSSYVFFQWSFPRFLFSLPRLFHLVPRCVLPHSIFLLNKVFLNSFSQIVSFFLVSVFVFHLILLLV